MQQNLTIFFSQQEKGRVMLIFESRLGQNELERNVIKKRHESRLQFKINLAIVWMKLHAYGRTF